MLNKVNQQLITISGFSYQVLNCDWDENQKHKYYVSPFILDGDRKIDLVECPLLGNVSSTLHENYKDAKEDIIKKIKTELAKKVEVLNERY